MSTTRIEPFTIDMLGDAAQMLARAFVTNPLHVAAFGEHALAKNEAFFRAGLPVMKGPKFVAREGTRVLGFIHWVPAPRCQFPPAEKLRMVPAMVRGFGLRSSRRVGVWLSIWARHDPADAHVHLGPIGVSPDAQHGGIGGRLMHGYCEQLDRTAQIGYLETDRPENVAFYERFGFAVTTEIVVLGVRNFLMRRPAAS